MTEESPDGAVTVKLLLAIIGLLLTVIGIFAGTVKSHESFAAEYVPRQEYETTNRLLIQRLDRIQNSIDDLRDP